MKETRRYREDERPRVGDLVATFEGAFCTAIARACARENVRLCGLEEARTRVEGAATGCAVVHNIDEGEALDAYLAELDYLEELDAEHLAEVLASPE